MQSWRIMFLFSKFWSKSYHTLGEENFPFSALKQLIFSLISMSKVTSDYFQVTTSRVAIRISCQKLSYSAIEKYFAFGSLTIMWIFQKRYTLFYIKNRKILLSLKRFYIFLSFFLIIIIILTFSLFDFYWSVLIRMI